LEVRAGYPDDILIRSALVLDVVTRETAAVWKDAALGRGFAELPPAVMT
jgi:hypothetical protein